MIFSLPVSKIAEEKHEKKEEKKFISTVFLQCAAFLVLAGTEFKLTEKGKAHPHISVAI